MTSLIAWLLGPSSVPSGTLVWVTGGMGIAIALSVMMAVTVGILALQHERWNEAPRSPLGTGVPKRPAVVPSAV